MMSGTSTTDYGSCVAEHLHETDPPGVAVAMPHSDPVNTPSLLTQVFPAAAAGAAASVLLQRAR